MEEETFTLQEVAKLLKNNIPRLHSRLHGSTPQAAFEMGEKNMADIIMSFLENHGNVSYHGPHNQKMVQVKHRKDIGS